MSEKQKNRLQRLEMKAAPDLLGGVLVIHPDGRCVLNGGTTFVCRDNVPAGSYLIVEAPADAATWSAKAQAQHEGVQRGR